MRATTTVALIMAFILIFSFASAGEAAERFGDLQETWALQSIRALEERDLFEDLWQGEFLPHQPLTRQEALELVRRGFELSKNEISGLETQLEKNFAAEISEISRGEFSGLLAGALKLGELQSAGAGWYSSFADLDPSYPEFYAAEVLSQLRLLPQHMLGHFQTYRLITRSEAVYILNEALSLDKLEGTVLGVDRITGELAVEFQDGEKRVQLSSDTLFIMPKGASEKELNEGDQIRAFLRGEQALLVSLEQNSNAQVLMQGLNNLTQVLADVLTPAQLGAIIAGDWEQLGEEVRYEIYEELVQRGAAPWEADALLKQDWAALQLMLQERISQEAADYLEVAPELIDAALTRNWTKLWEYVQVELAERLLAGNWLKIVPKE